MRSWLSTIAKQTNESLEEKNHKFEVKGEQVDFQRKQSSRISRSKANRNSKKTQQQRIQAPKFVPRKKGSISPLVKIFGKGKEGSIATDRERKDNNQQHTLMCLGQNIPVIRQPKFKIAANNLKLPPIRKTDFPTPSTGKIGRKQATRERTAPKITITTQQSTGEEYTLLDGPKRTYAVYQEAHGQTNDRKFTSVLFPDELWKLSRSNLYERQWSEGSSASMSNTNLSLPCKTPDNSPILTPIADATFIFPAI
eukprot:Seg1705.6 transcript_id=Seg1705.6/GoldUCD/mRNA.D3Y31 product="hypothetical protein" protein_id=Seg1705.6/GoldUCD/D3Y31